MTTGLIEHFRGSGFWQEPRNRKATKAVASVVFLAVAAGIAWLNIRSPQYVPGALNETLWLCSNGHQFTMSERQLNDFYANHYGQPVTCPECGAPASRAIKCPHCGNVVAPGSSRFCPVCKQPLKGG